MRPKRQQSAPDACVRTSVSQSNHISNCSIQYLVHTMTTYYKKKTTTNNIISTLWNELITLLTEVRTVTMFFYHPDPYSSNETRRKRWRKKSEKNLGRPQLWLKERKIKCLMFGLLVSKTDGNSIGMSASVFNFFSFITMYLFLALPFCCILCTVLSSFLLS